MSPAVQITLSVWNSCFAMIGGWLLGRELARWGFHTRCRRRFCWRRGRWAVRITLWPGYDPIQVDRLCWRHATAQAAELTAQCERAIGPLDAFAIVREAGIYAPRPDIGIVDADLKRCRACGAPVNARGQHVGTLF